MDINQELSQNFLDFSVEANVNRAFADARDGLKPGQRAALWEMFIKGYASNKPHVKAAKISGGVIATWWPHGSTAVYETFARMSQSWINNLPEVDWHGANGSIQISGDPAADRYCEARLAKATEEGMFNGIKKNNVPMRQNFSEDEEWPEVLPAIYPRLMVNGCMGIGSTIANTWLPHSLTELSISINNYIATGKIDYDTLAPDFPTGGIIINKKELSTIYKTGKGKVIVRGKTFIKNNFIYITELPYLVYVEPFIESIKQLIVNDEIAGIENILNKSNKKELLIEIECNQSPQKVLSQLYRKTELQKSYSPNHYALVGKTPKLLTYQEYLDIFLQHNYQCIQKEFTFDLTKATNRLEIVNGLIQALIHIDDIITLIKSSDSANDAIKTLESQYDFTTAQATAIVNMKLGKLAHLESIELNAEKAELQNTITNCLAIINNEDKRIQVFLERFNRFVEKYGDKRRTELLDLEETSPAEEKPVFVPEDCIVSVLDNGIVKRAPVPKAARRNTVGAKNKTGIVYSCKSATDKNLLIFTSTGKMYKVLIDNIPTDKGTSLAALAKFESNEVPLTYATEDADKQYIFFITKAGLAKKVPVADFASMKKSGIIAAKFNDGDVLASVVATNDVPISIITKNGMCSTFDLNTISATSRTAKGVKGITLKDGDEVVAAVPHEERGNLVIVSVDGLGKRIDEALAPQTRGTKGVIISKSTIGGATWAAEQDSIMLIGEHSSVCVAAADIPAQSRTTSGVKLIKNNSNVKLVIRV